jgi:hypothetical protein
MQPALPGFEAPGGTLEGTLTAAMDAPADATSIAREAPDPEVARAALVARWQADVISAREHWTKTAFKKMREDQAFAAGRQWPTARDDEFSDETSERYVANITLRHVQSRTSAVYGKNPKIVSRRKERLMSTVWDGTQQTLQAAMQGAEVGDPASMAILEDAANTMNRTKQHNSIAKTLELLFAHEMEEQVVPFKVQMKANVRRGLTVGVGYVRLGYQRIMGQRPDQEQEIADMSQRLANLERLSADVADDIVDENSAEMEELTLALQAMAKTEEIIVREGLTFNYPDSMSIIPDENCKQLRGFIGTEWVAEEFYISGDRIKEIYSVDVGRAGGTAYRAKNAKGEFERSGDTDTHGTSDGTSASDIYCVWEIYHRTDGLVYTICDGYKDFLLTPSEPDVWLERFYPWFPFVVNEVYDEGSVFPPSDVRLMRDMQTELNRARQGLREQRRASRPVRYARKGALSADDKDALQECRAHEVVEIESMQSGERIEDMIQSYQGGQVDPRLYDTRELFDDYNKTLGQHEASLGGTSGATATETSIAESSRMSTVSSTVDDLDEFLTELARAAGQILLTEASEERVKETVGPGAVWPDLSRMDVAKEIYLDVEAASTGRPNKSAEIQNAQQVFPLLMQIPGMSPEWMATELLKRMDDRLDVAEAFMAGMPSIMAMNATNGGQPQSGDPASSPNAQGSNGGNNAPSTEPAQVNAAPRPPQAPDASQG